MLNYMAHQVDFKQYANLDDLWIDSILQQTNSIYYEGMSVPQRIILVDIESTTGDIHTLSFSHQATKLGIHAYDWLTAWNQGNIPPLSYTPWGENLDPGITASLVGDLHNKSGSYEIFVDVPDDPFISKDGSTQVRINEYELIYGNRQIRICGNQPITSASFNSINHDVSSPSGDTGDSYINYELTWTSTSDQILIELGGHLSLGGDPGSNPIAWGIGLGSSSVSGGPYHFRLNNIDGEVLGAQDNQILGSDVLLNSNIVITKTPDIVISKVGDTITYTICITNTGATNLENIIVTDPMLGGPLAEFSTTLAIGATECHSYTYTVQIGDPDPLCNTVTVHSDPEGPLTNDITDTDTICIDLVQPCIEITKTPDVTTSKIGDTITYTICITNCGNINLENVAVSDPMLGGPLTEFSNTLAIGATECHSYTYTVQQGDPDPLCNTVTVHSDPEGPLTNDITDQDIVCIDIIHPGIDLEKYVSVDNQVTWHDADNPTGPVTIAGCDVYFKYIVTNTGDVDLTLISLTDSDFTLSCIPLDPLPANGGTFECIHGPVTAIAGQHTNTAIVTGEYNPTVSDTDDANYLGLYPCIDVDKKVWNPDTQTWEEEIRVPIGTDILFKINVTNCGQIDLTNIRITDTLSYPQLEYRDNANPPEDFVSPDLHTIIWDIPILHPNDIFEITFHAESVDLCFGWNKVNVSTSECVYIYAEDLLPVKVIDYGQPIMDITKLVWDDFSQSWTDMVTRSIGTILTFKITVNCTATSIVHNVIVTDDLPNNLVYGETVTPGITIISESPHQVKWDLGDMSPGEKKEIIYKVRVSGEGLGSNVASVTTSEFYHDVDSVLVKSIDVPVVRLIYPRGGEQLTETENVKWFAADTDENLEIYLYYSADNGITWRRLINDPLKNNIDQTHGEYPWDTTDMADGEYMLKVEAMDSFGGITHDNSDPFSINNGYTNAKISDIAIKDITINSYNWVKNGDAIEITAGITGGPLLTKYDIKADLTGFSKESNTIADNYDGFTARWIITGVNCYPINGELIISIFIEGGDTKQGSIIADNTPPTLDIKKPNNYIYIRNIQIIPFGKIIIIGPITINTEIVDTDSDIQKVNFILDDNHIATVEEKPYSLHLNKKLQGSHVLEIMVHDFAGNINSASIEFVIFNLFGK
jgi:uncharacterized repeat protein (TIGR01451 family)